MILLFDTVLLKKLNCMRFRRKRLGSIVTDRSFRKGLPVIHCTWSFTEYTVQCAQLLANSARKSGNVGAYSSLNLESDD